MKPSTAAALLAGAASPALAFSNSSPFILFSTAKLPAAPSTSQLQTSSQLLANVKSLLSSCPTKRYVFVSQPNMHAADFRDGALDSPSSGRGCLMPHLCDAVRAAGEDRAWSVAEVVGQVSAASLEEHVNSACGEGQAVVERVQLKHLPAVSERKAAEAGAEGERGRKEVLADNDYELSKLLDALHGEFTVVVFSDPNEFQAYEPEFSQPVHTDMKRWADKELPRDAKPSDKPVDKRPLFEKYQFFTPGIFMAFIVLAVLLSILGVGLKSLASLEVSYGAFDKELGPAAQKKQL
ncbi:hypothetical protein VTJ83DRAFT_1886 [Remersonia thermophila]|uniref:Protein BIG1 n=1 Tax=Remersonia thermophila TaxID=72144 RepID=A0ABR4DJH7_9PEZI